MPRGSAPGTGPDKCRLLLAGGDAAAARLLAANLGRPATLAIEPCESGEAALRRLAASDIDVLLADHALPDMSLTELLPRVTRLHPSLPVVVLTADTSLERVTEVMRAGAAEVVAKPVNTTILLRVLDRVLRDPAPDAPGVSAGGASRVSAGSAEHFLAGDHPRIAAIRAFAEQVARVPDARVLITGETGTGKSRLAHAIHELSGTAGRMVEVNCAALPPQLLESELFGHEAGAFTDARTQKRGLVELADRGTLFLDEIGTMPLDLQAKLLLFIERREIRRVGGSETVPVRCRLITATHENLHQRVRDRTFRQDLLFRLDVAAVEMPPLREMRALIPDLARLFVQELAAELGVATPELDAERVEALADYPWPGNVRELRNAIERALIFHTGGTLRPERPTTAQTQEQLDGSTGVLIPLGVDLDELERRYLAALLERSRPGELSELAAMLGISRKTLWEKRRRHKL